MLLLFAVCFGPFINQFSLFWDDWVQLLSRHLYGYPAYFRYFFERPLSGWTHFVFGPLIGDSRLGWEIFTLGIRACCVLAAWWLFQAIWPRYRRDAALAALLFAVYPGFTQQPISVAYSQHWLQYLLFLLSLVFMVLHRHRRAWGWLAAALACQLLQFSITEFFVGVEFIRPVLLWILLREETSQAGRRQGFRGQIWAVLKAWAPYLGVFVLYLVWRLFILNPLLDGRNNPSLFTSQSDQPLVILSKIGGYVLRDVLYQMVLVWDKVGKNVAGGLTKPIVLLGWGVGLAVAAALGMYLTRLRPAKDAETGSRRRVALSWIAAGFFGMLVGPAPLWATAQDILTSFDGDAPHADRFALPGMVWAALLLAGLLLLLAKSWRARAIFTAALVGLLATFQFRLANAYRAQSVDQTTFYWELAWRAPSLAPGTAVIAENILFPNQGLFATSGAINLLYPQEQNPYFVNYWVYSLEPSLKKANPSAKSVHMQTNHRIFAFLANTPETLLVDYDRDDANCMWVLRPQDQDYPGFSEVLNKWLPASNLARIGREGAAGYPSAGLFGPEPAHGWCYFFEKADLARQYGDWQTAASLGDQARAAGYAPARSGSDAAYEWMPFLEAYVHLGRWDDASGLVHQILAHQPDQAGFLCARWKSLASTVPSAGAVADQSVRQAVCTTD